MKRKIIYLAIVIFIGLASVHAQEGCSDTNKYVNYKNVGSTGAYVLTQGVIEKAAQTYLYSGPGKINSVRVYGSYSTLFSGGVPLRVNIYNVDANGRPTSVIQHSNVIWWWYDNFRGYIDVPFPNGGVAVNHNFAVEVELRVAILGPWGTSFNLRYTGNGEGRGQDLASLAGTSTGGNWSSSKNDFNMDGDFYLVPKMTNFITSQFTVNSQCLAPGTIVNFTNTTQMSLDSQFNTIGLSTYTGNSHFYEWNFGDGSAASNAVNPNHSYASQGVYTVSLKSTLVGWTGTCSDTKTMRISVGLTVSAGSIVNASCAKSSNGSIVAQGAGGTGVYTYSITNETYQSSPNFTGLHAGAYLLWIRDDLGCFSTATFNITEPPALVFAPFGTTDASCGHSDGAILASVSGGTGSIQYQLNSGSYQASGAFPNIQGGTYTITVKDANNCTASASVGVSNAGGPSLSVISNTNASCNNGSDGSIVLQGTGGSGVLQYSINGGLNYQASGSFLNLPAGTYGTMVKDANGCTQSEIIILSQPPSMSLTASTSKVSCYGGSDGQINVTSAIGGTGSFSYSINGTVYQSGTNFAGLTAGTYTVYAKDIAGCIGTTQAVVFQPVTLSVSLATTPAGCFGSYDGSIVITASGGTGSYSYSIAGSDYQNMGSFFEVPAGNYTIHVTDENHCVASASTTVTQPAAITSTINTTTSTCGNSNGGFLAVASGGSGSGFQYSINDTLFNSTGSFSNLSSGSYYVIIVDGSGCSNVFPANIVDANGPTITGTTFTNVSCNGGSDGSITVTGVTGGTGVLQYSTNGATWQTSPVITGLAAGSHIITVKDANGCTGTVTQALAQPNAFVINTTLTDVTCHGDATGAAAIYASGGSGVFAYTIDNGLVYQSSNVFEGLGAGSYNVIVRDAAGCNSSVPFVLTQPSAININAGVLNVSCYNASNGSISVSASGGTGHYQYGLNSTTFQNSNVFSNLSGQYYTVYVKDSSSCVSGILVFVREPAALIVTPTVNNVSCSGGNNGSVSLEVDGGTLPNVFRWSNEATTQDIFNLSAGTYYVTVVDANGCNFKDTSVITQPAAPLVVNGVVTDLSSSTSADGAIVITVTGGVMPYTYSWTDGFTSKNLSGLLAGKYTVNIIDANGCITSGIFTVNGPSGIQNVGGESISVILYPNPSSEMATMEVKGASISDLKIISATGALIFESEPNQSIVQINSGTLASGVYFVQVLVEGNLITRRMIVNR